VEAAVIKTTRSGRGGSVRVTFALPAGEPSGAVSVVGDFNGWDPLAHPLRRRANGTRSAAVTVPAGTTLRFRYLAEGGIWFNDDTAPEREGQDASIAVLIQREPCRRPHNDSSRPAPATGGGARIRLM
jgi:1,4-alpha-glucan branching enzyme